MTDTTRGELERVLSAAAASTVTQTRPSDRAALLRGLARALERSRDELVALAVEESHLPPTRLSGELDRTAFQLRFLADALIEGGCFDAVIEHADPDFPLGPRPDLRRVSEPIGPVLVFAASNFPFAFSVLGGDAASALAAGCPVIVKAHPGHPALSARIGEIAAEAGAPLAVVHGLEAGRAALLDPRVRAAAFTGSTEGGRALFDIATRRPDPIPFFGELGSVNPVFVSAAAIAARGAALAQGFVTSFTLGVGQFCTKPGLLLLPVGHGLDEHLISAVQGVGPAPMLGDWIHDRYASVLAERVQHPEVSALVSGTGTAPTLLSAPLSAVLGEPALLEECFGPTSLVATYDDDEQLLQAADAIDGVLTATIHAEDADVEWARPLLQVLRTRAGRVLWNGWPTGVAVSAAMHHGGPWPSTTSPLHSSVGGNAITRFLRPVSFQGFPDALLPPALQEANPLSITRRTDGVLS